MIIINDVTNSDELYKAILSAKDDQNLLYGYRNDIKVWWIQKNNILIVTIFYFSESRKFQLHMLSTKRFHPSKSFYFKHMDEFLLAINKELINELTDELSSDELINIVLFKIIPEI